MKMGMMIIVMTMTMAAMVVKRMRIRMTLMHKLHIEMVVVLVTVMAVLPFCYRSTSAVSQNLLRAVSLKNQPSVSKQMVLQLEDGDEEDVLIDFRCGCPPEVRPELCQSGKNGSNNDNAQPLEIADLLISLPSLIFPVSRHNRTQRPPCSRMRTAPSNIGTSMVAKWTRKLRVSAVRRLQQGRLQTL
jgi:hypothetical protein